MATNKWQVLSASMSLDEFDNGYWYATQLKTFATQIGVPSASKLRKDELERAIKFFYGQASSRRRLSDASPRQKSEIPTARFA